MKAFNLVFKATEVFPLVEFCGDGEDLAPIEGVAVCEGLNVLVSFVAVVLGESGGEVLSVEVEV